MLQFGAMRNFRIYTCCDDSRHINEVLKLNVLQRFTSFLSRYEYPELQFEALWTFTNITASTSENVNFLVEADLVPTFCSLLKSEAWKVREQASWTLSNICGDGPNRRDLVLLCGALIPILNMLVGPCNTPLLRT